VLLAVVAVIVIATVALLLWSTIRSIRSERTDGLWRQFSLSLVLMILFFSSWIGQAISQWQVFTDEQSAHGEPVALGDFAAEFAASTLENWQSEFLQLFSFVVLSAMFIHKGSAESKDADEKLEASLRRIEEKLGTLPDSAPTKKSESWKLPDTPEQLAVR
jgi:hypothetical protein